MIRFYEHLLDSVGVKWTRAYLQRVMDESSYKWSLFGVSAVLSRYGVESECMRYADKEELDNEDLPCVIVYGSEFAEVEALGDDYVEIFTVSGRRKVSKEEFYDNWTGAALRIRATAASGEPGYEKNHREQGLQWLKRAGMIAAIGAIVLAGAISSPLNGNGWWWAILAVNIVGIGISYLLLLKQLHISNSLSDKICGMLTKQHGCDGVVNSAESLFLGLVKFSEIGGAFFMVNTLALLFLPSAVVYLAAVAVVVLPFTFWSVWFQKFKARQWCGLCLCTLAVMWLQAIGYVAGGFIATRGDVYVSAAIAGVMVMAGYIATCLGLNAIMAMLARYKTYKSYYADYFNVKYNDTVVKAFEGVAERFDTTAENCSSMIFGNPDAKTRITVFSNPYCGPCAKMHEEIKGYPGGNVCVQYVLTFFNDGMSEINRYLIAAYFKLGAERTWELMTQWYGGGKSQGVDFFKDYGLDTESEQVGREFAKHRKWREDDRLIGTPTVMVNGLEVSYPYSVTDYMYL